MARASVIQRDDVLGAPVFPRKHNAFKGAFVDAGQEINPGDVVRLMSEAEEAVNSVKALTVDQVDGNVIQKWAEMGLPVMGMLQRQQGIGATQAKFEDALQKMGLSPDVAKEITLSGLGNWTTSDGPWLYDLAAPAYRIFPVLTPIVNKMPRDSDGVGTSFRFRRIDGISGSDTGGVSRLRISFNESVSTSFRGVSLNRPQKVAYATSFKTLSYKLMGISDDLTWTAQFAGKGFDNLFAMIARNLIFAHKMGEEHMLIGGRTTALSTPAAPTTAQRAPAAGESAISGAGSSVFVKVTALGHFGESIASAATTQALTGGNVVDVTVSNAFVAGAHGFRVYVSTGTTDPGDASRFRAVWNSGPSSGLDYSGGNLFTISGALPTTGDTAANHTTDGSASTDDFDGMVTELAANGGVSTRLNGSLTLDAVNKNLFYPLFQNFGGDPDEVFVNALESIRLTDLVLGASGTPYRVNVASGSGDADIVGGYRVSRLMNKITGKLVDVTAHRNLEQGNLLAVSWAVPYPTEGIDTPWKLRFVQDMLQVNWPVIQMSYDTSTYAFGVLASQAPVLSGILQGIQPS